MGLVAGTKFWSLRLDFAAKMASSHDATSPCDLLQGLVTGTSPIVCADLKDLNYSDKFDNEKIVTVSVVVQTEGSAAYGLTYLHHYKM